jgi:alpha-tubulin suppressor-like RCC1 family protein
MPFLDRPITNFRDSNDVDLGKKLVTKDYLLEVYGTILENSPASGLIVTPELWVWGRGNLGQLGINNLNNRSIPVTTFAGGTTWKQVSGGSSYTAAIKTDGSLWTWGRNSYGQLGDNTTTNRSIPVTTFAGGTDWKQVSCGNQHIAAIKTDGSLWTWGRSVDGRIGTNDITPNRLTPVTTFAGGTNWKQVSCSISHTAALKTDGSLWSWGFGNEGQLGNNVFASRSTPVTTFSGGTTWKQVSAGSGFTASVKTDGTLWVWGLRNNGRLGRNDNETINVPATTFAGGTTWKSVFAGSGNTAAIKTDGSLWVWGSNSYDGGLGINDLINRSTPVTTFAGGNNWKFARWPGRAIKTDGTLWVWGSGANGGQIGVNDEIQSEVLQSQHLPEETIGNLLLAEVTGTQQQSKP